jgi:guanosine-3',5'-bis(diphosphate) 3'-pyrophosphohydrolase
MSLAEKSLSAVEELMDRIRRYDPEADVEAVRRAYDFAAAAHEGQTRDSGASYIEHPLDVARTLADLELDTATIIASLLHDVVEDTIVELAEVETRFGPEVARLVDGVTKLSQAEVDHWETATVRPADAASTAVEDDTSLHPVEGSSASEASQKRRAANIRKIFLAMARDVRVMIIKLADRVHNMQTLGALPEDRRQRIAQETLQIFAPLAHRLGIWQFKWQLEDLSFKYLYPEKYSEIAEKLKRTRKEREEDIKEVREILMERLQEDGIKAEIQGRPKHLWSIFQKIEKQELQFNEIYDLIAVRIIVDTIADCYHALGVVHELWLPIQSMFSDYIARPKSNMYQSLHTKVIGPRGEPLEIQIRTWEMHRTADFGIAAHWQYKEGGRPDRRFEEKLAWLRQQLFDWQSDARDSTEFLRSVIDDLFTDQVFVFTPRGDVVDLPAGSCPLDFAFRIHSDVGLHCVGAKVNGRIVPLSYRFKNGDIVEIMTRPSAQPSYDWLQVVKTSHAKSRIKAWFRKQRHAENLARGRELLEKEAVRLNLDAKELLSQENLQKAAQLLNVANAVELQAAVGFGHVAASTVVGKLRPQDAKPEVITGRPMAAGKLLLTAGGVDDLHLRRSKCCEPLPGEDVIGFVTRGKGMAIHRRNCPNLQSLMNSEPERIVQVAWKQQGQERHSVRLRIETLDRVGLLTEIAAIFSERKTNIESANIRSQKNRTAVFDLVVDVADLADLDALIQVVQQIPDVLAVVRVGPPGDGEGSEAENRQAQAASDAARSRGGDKHAFLKKLRKWPFRKPNEG